MSRSPRIYFEGAIYHITARGDNKEKIFGDYIDKRKYLKIVKECQAQYDFEIYVYMLMPNHVHFVIEPSLTKANISVIMHKINNNYARYFIWKYKRVGHVFQGRFFSNIIEKDTYLLNLIRYIHLNPVRANLVKNPHDWEWSSVHEYLGKGNSGLKVNTDFVLNMLASNKEEQIKEFNQLLAMDTPEEDKSLKQKLESSFFVGTPNYISRMNQRFGTGKKKMGRPKKRGG